MREYRHLLKDVPLELVSLDDLGITEEMEETGETFAENAWLKASSYARLSGMLTLSDDSGLEVHALGGEPGINSARYGGGACTSDDDRLRLLLRNLDGVPWQRRIARFKCVIAICSPDSGNRPFVPRLSKDSLPMTPPEKRVSVVGSVAGMIQYEPEGNEGFGYDPVFYLPSYRQTMSQLPPTVKNTVSHRADAARKAVALLRKLAES